MYVTKYIEMMTKDKINILTEIVFLMTPGQGFLYFVMMTKEESTKIESLMIPGSSLAIIQYSENE